MEELIARVMGVQWREEDGQGVILRVAPTGGRPIVSALGNDQIPCVQQGMTYRFGGRWRTHSRHGRQFRFDGFVPQDQPDKDGVTIYLRKMVSGVGPVTAEQLWDAFGPDAVRVLREEPEKVVARGLLTAATAERASEQLKRDAANEATRLDLMSLLSGRGFQVGLVIEVCLRMWGVRSASIIRRNPYRLMLSGVPSCGWKRCDRLYLDLGHSRTRLKRQALAAEQAVCEARDGHTWHAARAIGTAVERAIGSGADPLRALRLATRGFGPIRPRLAIERVGDERYIALAAHAEEERGLAECVRRMMRWTGTTGRNSERRFSNTSSAGTSTPTGPSATSTPTTSN